MTLRATSSMVVDLSGDNDSAGALAATASIPSASADAAFERSCDNPECSAPKLISLVPKKDTSEFISDPVVMNQPTLINGFTTVFQIDGTAAKMNELMYGDSSESSSNGGTSKPKSVFRIVPNTHAHIVNYVVVDGAGETMRKIKANDADTMRKLLDSQRLSAEQMLTKLIAKAFKKPSNPSEPSTQPTNVPENNSSLPSPIITSVPVSKPTATSTAKQSTVSLSNSTPSTVLPTVPPGITITPIAQNVAQMPKSATLNAPAPVLRQALITPAAAVPKGPATRPTVLKRKLVTTPLPDVFKRLRPRSPKNKTPMALGLQINATAPQILKLPIMPKLPVKPTIGMNANAASALSIPHTKKLAEAVSTSQSNINSSPKENNTTERHMPTIESNRSVEMSTKSVADSAVVGTSINKPLAPVKNKPLIGPASKINALRSMAAARVLQSQNSSINASDERNTVDPKSKVTRVCETVITTTTPANQKNILKSLPKTKPCTVSIPKVDVPHVIQSLNRERSKLTMASPSNPLEIETIDANKTTMEPTAKTVHQMSIASPDYIPPITRTTASRIVETTTIQKSIRLPTKPPTFATISRKSDSALVSNTSPQSTKGIPPPKLDSLPVKVTRASLPKIGSALAANPTRVSLPMLKSVKAATNTSEKSPTPSLQSKNLRVVPPPNTSPHPNLKISSVISGGSAVAQTLGDKTRSAEVMSNENTNDDIEQLQKELADLRRTVARLSKRKL